MPFTTCVQVLVALLAATQDSSSFSVWRVDLQPLSDLSNASATFSTYLASYT
jgi:hypothetical protein